MQNASHFFTKGWLMMEKKISSKYMTMREVADYLGVSNSTVQREICDGKLEAVRIRGCYRIAPCWIDRYVETNMNQKS